MEESLLVGKNNDNGGRLAGKSTWGLMVEELKKLCYIALPMVVVTVSQNLMRVASMSMVGHLGELELAGTAVATSLTNVTGFSFLFGMSCALETLCGQAYGAGQFKKLGLYTYGGIIALILVCIPISILWIFMDKLLILIGQDPQISIEARKFAVWLIPSLFPYAMLQALTRYLQTQSLIFPMLCTTVVTLLFHIPVCWALVFVLELGIPGAALAIGISYTLNLLLLWLYVNYSSACEHTRICFSLNGLYQSVLKFFRVGIPSTIMICLEWWASEAVVLLAGLMANPQLQTSVLSICLTISTLHYFVPYALGVAASTRVSNELGAGNSVAAKIAVCAVMVLGLGEMIISITILLSCQSVLGYAFGYEKELVDYVKIMTPWLCVCVVVDCIQSILSGVARGCGWQDIGAYINLGAYYLAGIPVALVLGFVADMGGRGLWIGLMVGAGLQATLLVVITCFSDWKKQVVKARELVFEGSTAEEKALLS